MIEVKKYNIDCEYINDYWKNNLIIYQTDLITDYKKQKEEEKNSIRNLHRLSIDVNSYNEFKSFVENLEELNENEQTTEKKIKNIDDNSVSNVYYYKSKSTKPTLIKT